MARDNVLVSTDWVREHSSDDDVVLVEITEGGDNPSGRIPGAVSIDWTRDLQDPVRRDLVGPEEFSALLGRLGIDEHHTVVFYSGNNNWWAAAGYWQFRLYGHRELRMMDGGRALWEAQGGELAFDIPARRPTAYPVRPADESIRARRTDLLDGIGRTTLLDVRSLEEYLGERTSPPGVPQDEAVRPGHVLSARHIPWNLTVRLDGTYLPTEELEQLYGQVDGTAPVVVYCRIGWRSAHSWFVLHELLGRRDVSNYDGAWREFGAMVGAPVVRGPLPWGAVRSAEAAAHA
jgi:thiosulfate/3-mercaptopyruvate sulfurtransferase